MTTYAFRLDLWPVFNLTNFSTFSQRFLVKYLCSGHTFLPLTIDPSFVNTLLTIWNTKNCWLYIWRSNYFHWHVRVHVSLLIIGNDCTRRRVHFKKKNIIPTLQVQVHVLAFFLYHIKVNIGSYCRQILLINI